MPSLRDCITLAGKTISPEDADILLAAHKQHVADGYSAKDAEFAAVNGLSALTSRQAKAVEAQLAKMQAPQAAPVVETVLGKNYRKVNGQWIGEDNQPVEGKPLIATLDRLAERRAEQPKPVEETTNAPTLPSSVEEVRGGPEAAPSVAQVAEGEPGEVQPSVGTPVEEAGPSGGGVEAAPIAEPAVAEETATYAGQTFTKKAGKWVNDDTGKEAPGMLPGLLDNQIRVKAEAMQAAPVNIGPRDETVSTGTGVPTAKETAILAEQKRLIDEHLAKQKAESAPVPKPAAPEAPAKAPEAKAAPEGQSNAAQERIAAIDAQLVKLQARYEKKMNAKGAMVPPAIKADALRSITKLMDKLDAEKSALQGKNKPASLTDTPAPVASSRPQADVEADVAAWRKRNRNAPAVEVVNDPNWRDPQGLGIEGQYVDGKLTINAAFAPDAAAVARIANHEWAHDTLASKRGQMAVVTFAQREIPRQQLERLARKYPEASRLDLIEEWLTENAETEPGIFQRIVERLREWLARMGMTELTNEEAGRALLRALRAGKDAAAMQGQPRFSKTEPPGEETKFGKHVDTMNEATGQPIPRDPYEVKHFDEMNAEGQQVVAKRGLPQALQDAIAGDPSLSEGVGTTIMRNAENDIFTKFLAAKDPAEKERLWNDYNHLVPIAGAAIRAKGRDVAAAAYGFDRPDAAVREAKTQLDKKRDNELGNGKKPALDIVKAIEQENAKGVKVVLDELDKFTGVVPVTKSIWERYKDRASQTLLKAIGAGEATETTPPPLEDPFVKSLVGEITNMVRDAMPKPASETTPRPAIDAIADAIKNPEKYRAVWEQTKEQLAAKYAEQPEKLAQIFDILAGVLDKPFSKKTLNVAFRNAHKQMGVRVGEIIKQHFTKVDAITQSLAEKLTQDAGLTEAQAKPLADAVTKRMAELTREAKLKAIANLKKKHREPGMVAKVQGKTVVDRLVEMSNVGALDDESALAAVAKELKLPGELTPAQAKKLYELQDKVQTAPVGMQRNEATIELLTELKRIGGIGKMDVISSIYYAHILSGLTTQATNAISTALNTTTNLGIMAVQNPKQALDILRGAVEGAKYGLMQAKRTLATGYADRDLINKAAGTVDAESERFGQTRVSVLEVLAKGDPQTRGGKALKEYAKKLRYIGRAMQAVDTVFFESAQAAMQHVTAAQLAAQFEDGTLSTPARDKMVADLLNMNPAVFAAAEAQAKAEGLSGFAYKMRVAEIVRQGRRAKIARMDSDAGERVHQFALTSTFNQIPRGAAGIVARKIAETSEKIPSLRLFVPFTNIVANVANESMNWSPVGIKRSLVGYKDEAAPTGWDRDMLVFKGTVGTIGLVALAALAIHGGDDEKEPLITGRGPKDKNKRDQLRDAGYMPYSIKIGDRRFSYLLTPFSIPAAIIGNLADSFYYDKADSKTLAEHAGTALAGIPGSITSQSFLSGLSQLADIMRGQTEKPLQQLLKSAIGSVIPNIAQQIDRAVDPKMRDTSGVLGTITGKVPVNRSLNFPAVPDVRGRDTKQTPLISRFIGQGPTDDELAKVLLEKRAHITGFTRPMLGPPNKKRPATDEEFNTYKRESGQAIERRLLPLLPRLRSMPSDKAQALISTISEQEHLAARIKLEKRARFTSSPF